MERHYCTFCGKKRNADNMIKIRYHLLHKDAWHCIDCYSFTIVSSAVDIGKNIKKKYLLEQ